MTRPGIGWVACFFLGTLLLFGSAVPGTAQETYLDVRDPEPVRVAPGSTGTTTLAIQIRDGWHVNANPASEPFLIPTELAVVESEAVQSFRVNYPEGSEYEFSFASESIRAYEGEVDLPIQVGVASDVAEGNRVESLRLTYQPCDDENCLPPRSRTVDLTVMVDATAGEQILGQSEGESTWWGLLAGSPDLDLMELLSERGIGIGILVTFGLGLMLNLTPCVYPMVPVTIGYFGGRDEHPLTDRIVQALLFLAGLVLIYTMLGALAGWTGAMLGLVLQQPAVLVTIALILIGLSGVMFGWYRVRIPEPILRSSDRLGRGLGSFGMGMTLGVIAAPCLAPATVALLTFVGRTESMVLGAGMFFVLSLGMGVPYVVLAVFSSSLSSLPGAGRWMGWVKTLLGFLILAVAWYFLWGLVPTNWFAYGLILLVVVAALVLSYRVRPRSLWMSAVRTGAILLVAGGLIVATHDVLIDSEPPIDWVPGQQVLDGNFNQRPSMVYVRADWCPPCKQMEVTTFHSETLADRLEANRVTPVKLDVTQQPEGVNQQWVTEHEIVGVPTLVFLDEEGRPLPNLRIDGYATSGQIASRLDRLGRTE